MPIVGQPRSGEIYRSFFPNGTFEVLVTDVEANFVYFVSLGYGKKSGMGVSIFKRQSFILETRLQRLRRACEKYKLTETDKLLEKRYDRKSG